MPRLTQGPLRLGSTHRLVQIVAAAIGTFDAAGRSLAGDGRQNLPPADKAELRKQFFKKRPLADQVMQPEAAQE